MPQQQTKVRSSAKVTYEKPKNYVVIMFNDNVTTMEFVVMILQKIFYKSDKDAESIMLKVHNDGQAIVGVYSLDMARTKVKRSMSLAQENDFPLLLTFEPEE